MCHFIERGGYVMAKGKPKKNNLNTKKYGILLKRKRLEMKKTLEEVAQGVCTVSYLSRIENNMVEVDESYFSSLFKKLNMDFSLIKEEKENEIFTELFKCYLQENDDLASSLISNAIKTSFYSELEYELMMLYDNIIRQLYKEALKQIVDLNNRVDLFLEQELTFYLFLTALYTLRTSQALIAYRQIIVLCETTQTNPVYRYAIYDLALDIFEYIGANELFSKYYYLLNNDKYSTIYPKSFLKHQAQNLYLEQYLKKDEVLMLLDEIYDSSTGRCKEEVEWQILKTYYRNKEFNRCLKLIEQSKSTPKLLALESLIVLRLDDYLFVNRLEERRKNTTFRISDECFELMYLVCMQIIKYQDYRSAFDLFKKLLMIQNNQTYLSFLFDEQLILFIEIASKCGKYKDALKLTLNILKDKKLFPYFL